MSSKLNTLGYTEKWIEFRILTEDTLNKQFLEFLKGKDNNTEHYRYNTLLSWINTKTKFTDLEIKNLVELTLNDSNSLMAGAALKELFISNFISESQFQLIKNELSKFGDWTVKLVQREELKRKIHQETLDKELIEKCILHSKEFEEYFLIKEIIRKAESLEIIEQFTNNDFGKKIRNIANEKIKILNRAK